MFKYIARVELEGFPTSQDYDNLHEAMRKQGFLRTVSDSNKTFHLPTGEYVWSTSLDRLTGDIRTVLQNIISDVHKSYLLIVAKAKDDEVSWYLRPVSES